MSLFDIVILVLVVLIVVGIATGIEWTPGFLKHKAANRKSGLNDDPKLRGQLFRIFFIIWVSRTIQVILLGVVAFTKPSIMGWMVIVVIFGITVILTISSEGMRRQLMVQG